MTPEDADAFLREYFYVRMPAKKAKEAELEKVEAEKWLADVKAKNPNIQTTESGLMYEVLDFGDMAMRAETNADEVLVNYKGTLRDGSTFDANDSIPFTLGGVIPAWTEGMKLIGKGGKIVLWAPASMAYGERGSGKIPGNAALKFEVDLLDVTKAEIPADATK